ncbi:alanyl-tRNA synthetase [Aspergillus bombycis]|uniref:Alanyl-tRNA synthetase n=1 Tax=Aspergillus bombycis TaxID=109264 RepID=A0A1F7ZQH6_9EURO|nr:alanyl-tRNA synthetase [Aspergillus bombycis]OGM41693.1 alanyl-tRNA synthetase [Aspergillus bombycis]
MTHQDKTELLYLNDASLRQWTTTVLSCQPISQLTENEKSLAKTLAPESFALTTRETVFYPQGGGQPSDTGVIALADTSNGSAFKVLLVRKTMDGTVLHLGEFTDQPCFADGQLVSQVIDGAKRDYHSRLHTAGHIIGLAMRLLAPVLGDRKKVKANHAPGQACMEFEGLLYTEHKAVIEDKVNELVGMKLPVTTEWWDEDRIKNADLNMVEGLQLGNNGQARIALIGDIDANPCGGTHVEHTGLTGFITIRKIARQKGISKVSYEVPVSM